MRIEQVKDLSKGPEGQAGMNEREGAICKKCTTTSSPKEHVYTKHSKVAGKRRNKFDVLLPIYWFRDRPLI